MLQATTRAALPFEDALWAAADSLRGEIEEGDYKYPPDKQEAAVNLVIEQARLFGDELSVV